MISFWIIGACLLAATLMFLLPPLLQGKRAAQVVDARAANLAVYKSQFAELDVEPSGDAQMDRQRERLRVELAQRLLADSATSAVAPEGKRATAIALLLAVLLPLAVVLIYLQTGQPGMVIGQGRTGAATDAPHALDNAQIVQMVDRLAKRLAANGQDPEGWSMLARSYTALGRYADAASAYERAIEQRTDDAQLLADYADLLAMLQNRKLQGKPAALVARALRIDPANPKALALAGTAAYEQRDYAMAAHYWERLLDQAPAGSELERSARSNVAEARALASGQAPSASGAGERASASARIAGTVRIDPAIVKKLPPDSTVFVFARTTEGPRMPVAIVRMRLADLPATFVLDDRNAMDPSRRISTLARVVVGARLSRSGSATAAAGDIESAPVTAPVGSEGIDLSLDQERQ